MTKVTDDERLIEKSGYFREKWYLRNYPEAAGSGLAPARHYLQEGWKKGFRPSMQFDHEFYLNTYPEVNEAGICPLVHYEREGRRKGYFPNARQLYKSIWKQNRAGFADRLKFWAAKLGLPGVKKPAYLSLAAIIKNEAPYIREWVCFYYLNGVEKFYLYDNESEDNLREVLSDFVSAGIVEIINCPGKEKQVPAYNDALSRLRYKTQWLMIVDADEFMIVNGNKKISEFLKDYEKYAALAVNWVMYDYGGLLKKPEGLVLENYRTVHGKFHPKNLHVKSVINPRKVALCVNPHYCEYKGGNYAVNENFEKVVGPVTAVQSIEKIRLNHYYCKSYEEYEAKVARGLADSYFKYIIKKEDYAFDDATEDYVAGRFAGPVRSLMEKGV